MRATNSEKQKLTNMLGKLAEDRYFARVAQNERRAVRETEQNLGSWSWTSTRRQEAAITEGGRSRASLLPTASRRRWAWGMALAVAGVFLFLFIARSS